MYQDFSVYPFDGLNLFFIRPGQIHGWSDCEELKGICLLFDQTFCEIDRGPGSSCLLQYPFWDGSNRSPVLKVPDEMGADVQLIGEKFYQEWLEQRPWNDEIQRSLLHILFQLMRRFYMEKNPQVEKQEEKDALFKQFVEVIERELPAFKNVADYARIIGTSVSQLNKSVREAVGRTPASWLRERRLLEAKRLLIHSDLTFQEVAYELDFPDPSYFTKFFQKLTGMTPTLFKQKHQN